MEPEQSFFDFVGEHSDKLLSQTLAHIGLTAISLFLSVLVALPLGIWIAGRPKAAGAVLGIAGVLQTIPSIALLGFMIPLLGIGPLPAITALFLYALLPIIRNTYAGITGIDPAIVESARAMGMTAGQMLRQVQLPLAFPVILAGIRTATVINVGVATLAAYIAAGGLGEFIFGGIALNNTNMILAGAIPSALLAIAFDLLLSLFQKMKSRRGLSVFTALLMVFSVAYTVPQYAGDQLRAGFTPEFMGREDGYLGLRSKYQFDLPTVVISDAVMYNAAAKGNIDVISGYSTDGRLKAFDLINLRDDRLIFPPYHAAPLARRDVLQKYPELVPAINLLSGEINDSVMTALNYQVDYLKRSPERVAHDFLVSRNLYKKPKNGKKGVVRLGSKIFAEQYILLHMYRELIEGNTGLRVASKTGLGGTKVCFDALINNEIDMYPEYSGTGLLVLLKPSRETVKRLGTNSENVYQYVKKEFAGQYDLDWMRPIGFNNAYALMMRREQARSLNIEKISDLKTYANHHRNKSETNF